tara:strand:+ start:3878 stop:4138 length:261 start_codon:yes stop_codon:yes gene_type:complete
MLALASDAFSSEVLSLEFFKPSVNCISGVCVVGMYTRCGMGIPLTGISFVRDSFSNWYKTAPCVAWYTDALHITFFFVSDAHQPRG